MAHGPYAGDEDCPADSLWEALAHLVNSRCEHTPTVVALLDANANVASKKMRDSDHKEAFLAFLGATGMAEVTGALDGAPHTTFRSSTCSGVQIDYIAMRGRAKACIERACTLDDFVSAGAALDHSLIMVPVASGKYGDRPCYLAQTVWF